MLYSQKGRKSLRNFKASAIFFSPPFPLLSICTFIHSVCVHSLPRVRTQLRAQTTEGRMPGSGQGGVVHAERLCDDAKAQGMEDEATESGRGQTGESAA